MIYQLGQSLNVIFERSGDSEFSFDRACAVLCRKIGAASATILLYSALEDRLKCAGRYIDPGAGNISIEGDEYLDMVMKHMCACEYLYDRACLHAPGKGEPTYEHFKKVALTAPQTTRNQFDFLLTQAEAWKEKYLALKKLYREEQLEIALETDTITGEWFKRLLTGQVHPAEDFLVKSLDDIDESKKHWCLDNLKRLHVNFHPQFYIALPLTTGGRNFGVLRLLFPAGTDKINSYGTSPGLTDTFYEELKEIASILSLRLKLVQYRVRNKEVMLAGLKSTETLKDLYDYLDSQCELLVNIMRSNGALLREYKKDLGYHAIIGCSRSLMDYREENRGKANTIFESVKPLFESNHSTICLYFALTDAPAIPVSAYYFSEQTGQFETRSVDCHILKPSNNTVPPDTLARMNIKNMAIFPIPHVPGHFVSFENGENREFRGEDIGRVYASMQTLGLSIKERLSYKSSQEQIKTIREMHRRIPGIFQNKTKKITEYIDDFWNVIAHAVKELKIFPFFIPWELFDEERPGSAQEKNQAKETYLMRATRGIDRDGDHPFKNNHYFNYPDNANFPCPQAKSKILRACESYLKEMQPAPILDIPLKEGYSHIDLPVFPRDGAPAQCIISLVYTDDDAGMLKDEDFLHFLELLSYQVGMAWDRFQNDAAGRLMEIIDFLLGEGKRKNLSTTRQLEVIAQVFSDEIEADWCAVFLLDQQEKKLTLEADNIASSLSLKYPLADTDNIFVHCFENKKSLRLLGRKSLEEIFKMDKITSIEVALRQEVALRRKRANKSPHIPFMLIEHALVAPIVLSDKKMGLTALFRSKPGNPVSRKRFKLRRCPFSGFETYLLEKVNRHLFNIFTYHYGVQKRMRDIRNIITQVVRPIHLLIGKTREQAAGPEAYSYFRDILKQLGYAHVLSKIAANYIKNFEILLDLETGWRLPKRDDIPDVRAYLIGLAGIYQHLANKKMISVNITADTPSGIRLEADMELLDVVMLNMLDNAVKYSFNPADRDVLGLAEKPPSPDSPENVLVSAHAENGSITITISNYGIKIMENEKSRVFDNEFRCAKAVGRFPNGAGIGLYIARKIMALHGGKISFHRGDFDYHNIFELTLPLKQQLPPPKDHRKPTKHK